MKNSWSCNDLGIDFLKQLALKWGTSWRKDTSQGPNLPPKTRGKFETNCSKKRKKAKRMAKGRRRRRKEREKQQLSNQNTLATPSRVATVSLKQQIKQSKCRIHRHTVGDICSHTQADAHSRHLCPSALRQSNKNKLRYIYKRQNRQRQKRQEEREEREELYRDPWRYFMRHTACPEACEWPIRAIKNAESTHRTGIFGIDIGIGPSREGSRDAARSLCVNRNVK